MTGDATGMSITGGRGHLVLCEVIIASKSDAILVDPLANEESVVQIEEPADCAYPARFAVARSRAIEAARYFCKHGDKNPSLAWEP